MTLEGLPLVLSMGMYLAGQVLMIRGKAAHFLKRVVVPVKVHMIKDEYGMYTSTRGDHEIAEVFREVNRIWEQAGVYFKVEKTIITRVSGTAIPKAIYGDLSELLNHKNFDSDRMNAFFSKSLNGMNGFSLPEIGSIFVADFTTVNDFRTTAHEFGHILGLIHVDPIDRLMALGRNGEILSDSEVLSARENASRFLKKGKG